MDRVSFLLYEAISNLSIFYEYEYRFFKILFLLLVQQISWLH